MSKNDHTSIYNLELPDYPSHPCLPACIKALSKGLTKSTYINGNLETLSGFLRNVDRKLFKDIAKVHDFQRLFLRIGVLHSCAEENRYYFDHDRAQLILSLCETNTRLPVFNGDPTVRISKLKAEMDKRQQAKLREHNLRVVPSLPPLPDVQTLDVPISPIVTEISSQSVEVLIHQEDAGMAQTAFSIEDAVAALDVITERGPYQGFALVEAAIALAKGDDATRECFIAEKFLVDEIRQVLEGLKSAPMTPSIDPTVLAQIEELKQELLTTKAFLSGEISTNKLLLSENEALKSQLTALESRDREKADAILEQLKQLPGLVRSAQEVVLGSGVTISPRMPSDEIKPVDDASVMRTELERRLAEIQAEIDRKKLIQNMANHNIEQLAADLEVITREMQEKFDLTPQSLDQKQLKSSSQLNDLYLQWHKIRESIDQERATHELDLIEDMLPELQAKAKAIKLVLNDC